jgi:anti-sigma factor RsiW
MAPRRRSPSHPTSRCRAHLLELSRHLDGDLTSARRRAIERHIHRCTCCAMLSDRLKRTLAACRQSSAARPPRPVRARAAARVRALMTRANRRRGR